MRITIPIVSAGKRWVAKIPRVDVAKCYPVVGGEPAFDEDELRVQLRGNNRVQFSSDDFGTSAVAFAAILMASVGDWMDDHTKGSYDMPRVKDTLKRIDRRIERGNVTYCRIDIRRVRQEFEGRLIYGIKVEITTDGRGVVQPMAFEREFAMMVMDFCQTYSNRYAERGEPPLLFGPSAVVIGQELHERTEEDNRAREIAEINSNRMRCERRTSSCYCSPINPSCPCYCGGQCVEVKN